MAAKKTVVSNKWCHWLLTMDDIMDVSVSCFLLPILFCVMAYRIFHFSVLSVFCLLWLSFFRPIFIWLESVWEAFMWHHSHHVGGWKQKIFHLLLSFLHQKSYMYISLMLLVSVEVDWIYRPRHKKLDPFQQLLGTDVRDLAVNFAMTQTFAFLI